MKDRCWLSNRAVTEEVTAGILSFSQVSFEKRRKGKAKQADLVKFSICLVNHKHYNLEYLSVFRKRIYIIKSNIFEAVLYNEFISPALSY